MIGSRRRDERPRPGMVEAGIVERSHGVALLMRNAAFVLVAVVYLLQTNRSPVGVALFVVVLLWGGFRLITRGPQRWLLAVDVLVVLVAALAAPWVVPATIADVSMSSTRMIAYPTVVGVAIAEPKRWSFTVMAVIAVATAIGDVALFGAVDGVVSIFVINWWVATLVRRVVRKAAAATDDVYEQARAARLRERVATARIRFEREQFATLHDTAASTLMMVGSRSQLDRRLLATQASRDVAVLTSQSAVASGARTEDLVDSVTRVSRECRTPVDIVAVEPATVSLPIARAVTAAVRESLNNVDRHARATRAVIEIESDRVTITDDGTGFDRKTVVHGFGLRSSIEGRMRRIGGEARISSRPGDGTAVELSWPVLPLEETRSVPADVSRILRGFQYGLAVVSFVVLANMVVISFGGVPAMDAVGPWIVIGIVAATSPLVVVAARGWSVVRVARWIWIAVLVTVGVAYVGRIPVEQYLREQNWTSTSVGWAVAAVFTGWVATRRHVVIASSIVVGFWAAAGLALVSRIPVNDIVENAGYGIGSVATMQVAAISFGWILTESARLSAELGEQQAAAATQVAIEHAVQDDYRRRFAELTEGVVAVLRGLADGSLDAHDGAVQARSRAEYARLRRLFDQVDSFEHPLMQRLRPMVDECAARGVDVEFDVQSRPPDLHGRDLDPIVAAVGQLIGGARSRVRLVVSASASNVTVSVVSDCHDAVSHAVTAVLGDGDFQLTAGDSVTWLRVHVAVPLAA